MEPFAHEVFQSFAKLNTSKFGLICIPCLLNQFSTPQLKDFIDNHSIPLQETTQTRVGMMEAIFTYYATDKSVKDALKSSNMTRIDRLGEDVCNTQEVECDSGLFDFITRTELIKIFANFGADIGITTFKTPAKDEYGLDLYLTKKDPVLKTEAVMVATGSDIIDRYKDIFFNLGRAEEISDWKVFVTTPMAVKKIGFRRLLDDMEKLSVWLYVVDPVQKQIFGITKGLKSKRKNDALQEQYIRALPSQPIRAPSQVLKISTYDFSEKSSYRSKDYSLYYIPTQNHPKLENQEEDLYKYARIFRSMILMSIETGISFVSYSSEVYQVEDVMISGFLSAIDSFVQELSGSGSLKEIDYQNFKITAIVGQWTKLIFITSESADDELKERLRYFLRLVERQFKDQIIKFMKTGNQSIIEVEKMTELAKRYLLIK